MPFDTYQLRKTRAGEPVLHGPETWSLEGPHGTYSWDIRATYHKPVDILKMKSTGYQAFRRSVEKISAERNALFTANNYRVNACPVCGVPAVETTPAFEAYGAAYVNCCSCTHRYVINRLSKERLEEYYRTSTLYQGTYTQKEKAMVRVEEIHRPKLDWVLQQFERRYGRMPHRILDIGAGSGHFSVACRDRGITCDGVELSESGRVFAREVFGVELIDADFLADTKSFADRYELITFWGLIEHVPDPGAMLAAAARALRGSEAAMLVASVPRWESLSSVVQFNRPDSIIRHLDPLGHIQCFTDTSVAALVARTGLSLDAVWYFGMDAYELLIQLADRVGSDEVLIPAWIESLQRTLDLSTLADSMIFTAVP
jgi:2-polyprenyl-3-methyl-5-hydroxy-6-metoxy-1,4-benzoquinol methylase